MSELDYSYIATLVYRTCSGSSDAYAELFASTYQRQYQLAGIYLGDEALARQALKTAYVSALKNIDTLRDSRMFVSWLSQITFRTCYALALREDNTADMGAVLIGRKEHSINQLLSLPFSEAQALFLRFGRRMRPWQIAFLMEVRPNVVKDYLRSGKRRLAGQSRYVGGEKHA